MTFDDRALEKALQYAQKSKEKGSCTMFNRDELPPALKVPQVAALLQIANAEAYKLAASGAFPVIRIGKAVRIPRDTFLEWVAKNTIQER